MLHLEADYRPTLVGTPGRRHLWLLTRERHLPLEVLARMLREARAQGFDLRNLVWADLRVPPAEDENADPVGHGHSDAS